MRTYRRKISYHPDTVPGLEVNLATLLDCTCKDNFVCQTDRLYLLKRLKAEGGKFWSTTLPKFSKAILSALGKGRMVARSELSEFRWNGRLPQLFRGLLRRIFKNDGHVLLEPSAFAIKCIRNVCERIYKLAVDFTSEDVAQATSSYTNLQEQVRGFQWATAWERSLKVNLKEYPELSTESPTDILAFGPKFGPGAMVESAVKHGACTNAQGSWGKRFPYYRLKRLPVEKFPRMRYQFRHYAEHFKAYPGSPEQPSWVTSRNICEVLFVPKDSRGPRVISKEEPETIFAQMAFFRWAQNAFEKMHGGVLDLRDQDKNRELARRGSIDGSRATLDLKEASDRVNFRLVRRLFWDNPGVKFFLAHGRATHAALPNNAGQTGRGVVVPLGAVGGMGSGLTFPMLEILCHLSICTGVRQYYFNNRVPYKDVAREVHVYGDDCIVPTAWYESAVRGLTNSGLLVNADKSFAAGPFRESCGGDYVHGEDVGPIRLKTPAEGLPSFTGRKLSLKYASIEGMYQLNKHANELSLAGQNVGSEYLYDLLESAGIPMPFVGPRYPCFGRVTVDAKEIIFQAGTARKKVVRNSISWLPASASRLSVHSYDEKVKTLLVVKPSGEEHIFNSFYELATGLRGTNNLPIADLTQACMDVLSRDKTMSYEQALNRVLHRDEGSPQSRAHQWWLDLSYSVDRNKHVIPRRLDTTYRTLTTFQIRELTLI